MNDKRTLLVTGAAGFIGSRFSKLACEKGWNVVGVDNLNDYYDVGLKESRLKTLQSCKNFRFVKLDLADKEGVAKLFAAEKFSFVVNLAAQAGIRYSMVNPHSYLDSNVVGFLNVLEGCRKYPVKRLLYASSSSVYGDSSAIPFSTSDRADTPVSLYGATKRMNELMAHVYASVYGIASTGLRFFTVYGPWGRPDMAYFLFTRAILEGKPIKLFNNGAMKRDFTYIDDVTRIVLAILESYNDGKAQGGETVEGRVKVYNIGNSSPVSVVEFVEILERHLQKKAVKEMLPMQKGELLETYADVRELERDFNVRPTVRLEDGLREFVRWYTEYYAVPKTTTASAWG